MLEAIILMFVLVIVISTMAFRETKLSLKYKRRWQESLDVIKNQEDHYRELLEGGDSPPRWKLNVHTAYAHERGKLNSGGQGIFFCAHHQNGQQVQLASTWADKATPESISKIQERCLKAIREMNERETACT